MRMILTLLLISAHIHTVMYAGVVQSPTASTQSRTPATHEPLDTKPAQTKPTAHKRTGVTGYWIDGCGFCDVAKNWKNLPFEINWEKDKNSRIYNYVKSLNNNGEQVGYPIFEFKRKNGNYYYLCGAQKAQLVKDWGLFAAVTQEDQLGAVRKQNLDMVCGCRSENPGCCLCVDEIEAGLRKKPCTCSKTTGSYHYVKSHQPGNWNPSGATGTYYDYETRRAFVPEKVTAEAAPTPMSTVFEVLSVLKPKSNEVFVDYGCGYDARVCIAASLLYGCNSVGIEVDSDRAQQARNHVKSFGLEDKVTILNEDAIKATIRGDVAYAYLPPNVLRQLSGKLLSTPRFASFSHNPHRGQLREKNNVYYQLGVKYGNKIYTAMNQVPCIGTSNRCPMCVLLVSELSELFNRFNQI